MLNLCCDFSFFVNNLNSSASCVPSSSPSEENNPTETDHFNVSSNIASGDESRVNIDGEFLNIFRCAKDNDPQNPIVHIGNNLIKKIENEEIENLPPMLGKNIEINYYRKTRIISIIDLPEDFPTPRKRITVSNLNLTINLYDGVHWNRQREEHQRENKIEFQLKQLNLEICISEKLNYRIGVEIKDISVLDTLAPNRNTTFCYDETHTRSEGSSVLSLLMQQSLSNAENCPAKFHVSLLPLRVRVDSDAIHFLYQFVNQDFLEFADAVVWREIRISHINLQIDYKAERGGQLNNIPLSCVGVRVRVKELRKKEICGIQVVMKEYIRYFKTTIFNVIGDLH